MAIRKDALKAKPKAKLVSVAGAQAKAPAAAARTKAKAVKPSKKAVTKEPKRRDKVEGGTRLYSKSPK